MSFEENLNQENQPINPMVKQKENSGQKGEGKTPLISQVLRGGVLISAFFISLGTILFLITGKSGYALDNDISRNTAEKFTSFHSSGGSETYFPSDPYLILQGFFSLKPFAAIMLGLLFLIATPVVNIALLAAGFFIKKNWLFTFITCFILAVLVLSFLLGKAGG